MKQLYIDNMLVDLPASEDVTLAIKSNLLGDISKWVSSTSYTIKLPMTERNMAVSQACSLIVVGTDYPYRLHTADYIVDGVTIVRKGTCVVQSVTDSSIDVSISYGLAAFDKLSKDSPSLNTMRGGEFILFNKRNVPETYARAQQRGFFYASLDMAVYEQKVTEEWTTKVVNVSTGEDVDSTGTTFERWGGSRTADEGGAIACLHPSVKASWVLEKIRQQYNIGLTFPAAAQEYIDTLIMPLVTKKANAITWDDTTFEATLPDGITKKTDGINMTVVNAGDLFDDVVDEMRSLRVSHDCAVQFNVEYIYELDTTRLKPKSRGGRGDVYSHSLRSFYLLIVRQSGSEVTGLAAGGGAAKFVVMPTGWSDNIRLKVTASGKVDLRQGDLLKLQWTNPFFSSDPYGTMREGKITVTYAGADTVPFGVNFPIMQNLPDVKMLDFLKTLCMLTGTYPLRMKPSDTGITFADYSSLQDFEHAVDWSDKLATPAQGGIVEEMQYKVSDWARHNRYLWKEDDNVHGDYSGDIIIDGDMLEEERTVVTLPFAATDNSNVTCYTFSDGDGAHFGERPEGDAEEVTASYKACKDRILRLFEGSNGEAVGVFDIYLSDIISKKYAPLRQALQNAKVVKVSLRLSAYEVSQINESVPIYLSQFGAYFMLIELKYNGKETSEATLLRLVK